MDGLSLLYSLVQITDNVGKRTGFGNAHGGSLFVKGGLGTHPYNMVDGQLITENDFLIFVYVDESRQPGKRQTEIIEKSGILAVTESIVLIVQPLFIVTQKQ